MVLAPAVPVAHGSVQDSVRPGGHTLQVVLVAVRVELEGGQEVDCLLVKALCVFGVDMQAVCASRG